MAIPEKTISAPHRLRRAAREAPAWLVSLALHVAFVLALAVATIVPVRLLGPPLALDVGTTVLEEAINIETMVDLPMAEQAPALDGQLAADAVGSFDSAGDPTIDIGQDLAESIPAGVHEPLAADVPDIDVLMGDHSPSLAKLGVAAPAAKPDRPRWVGFKPKSPTAPEQGISVSSDAAVAASGIVTQIQGDLAEGQTYVVWLLDASISLLESRKVLAKTLEPFLSEHRPAPGKQGNLITAVVAYGAGVQMVADYSPLGNYGDIERLPIDPSGRENVMSAIIAVVNGFQAKFHKDPRRRDRLRIVIWTDESGDDNSRLEDVIALCRGTGTVVHVVGPTSALGSDRGLQPWFDKKTKGVYLLPVTRGPDSYLTERVLLPYWFDTDADAGEFDGVLVADGREWYGGPLRESLLSGVGPYALTRLALQTGGTFRLLDRPGEDRRFDLATMKDYLPEYASAAEIVEPILASPFRLGILQAVRATYDPVNLTPPRMAFVEAQRSRSYPFRFMGGAYVEQTVFRTRLSRELGVQESRMIVAARIAEDALACFTPSLDWEYEYSKETSRRWQAWYDLTRGRLLAMSIRYREYLTTCELLRRPGTLRPETNQIGFRPGHQLCGDVEAIRERRDEAIRLLERCRDRNRGTPWALLAEWELAIPLGIGVDQVVVPKPPPSPPRPLGGGGGPSLPSL